MKKVIMLAIGLIIALSIISCQEDEIAPVELIESSFVAQSSDIPLEKFRLNGNVWNASEVESIKQKGLGNNSNNPIVLLIVDKSEQFVLSKHHYQEIFAKVISNDNQNLLSDDMYFTDVETYQKVMGDSNLQPEHCPRIEDGSYIFDPYRTHYPNYQELEEKLVKNLKSSNISNKTATSSFSLIKGDILIGKWTTGNKFGHACLVYSAPSVASNVYSTLYNTTTFDAWGDMPNPADDIGYHNGSEYWLNSSIEYRYRLRYNGGLSYAKQNQILNYAISQDSDTYSLTTTIWNTSKWYCSKLVWRAYYNAGIEISGGEYVSGFVVPLDFLYDSDLFDLYF